jgi:hypothetical protein
MAEKQTHSFFSSQPVAPAIGRPLGLALGLALGFSPLMLSCGRRASFDLSQAPSSGADLRQGQTECTKTSCPKMELFVDVGVPAQGSYSASTKMIQVPGGSSTQIRFSTRLADASITRQAALLLKRADPWLTVSSLEAGAITVSAAPRIGATGTIEIQVRDITYCQTTSQNPSDCNKTNVPNDSDKIFSFTVSGNSGLGQPNGTYVLPSQLNCVRPPSDMEQSVGTLQQAFTIGSALMKGNFIPIITNLGSGFISGAQADRQGARQGC